MNPPQPRRVVHLELHTPDLCGASAFYGRLLRWRTERIDVRWGSYHALALGGALDGGIVECRARHATWLPYVEVAQIEAITERGRRLGASVLFEPREGPAGWSSVLRSSVGGEIAQRRLQRCLGTAEASTLATVDDWLRRLTGL
ncbi:MAG: hypothetical protein ACREQ5_24400 [Candidatus Dormibacteria bacterium]